MSNYEKPKRAHEFVKANIELANLNTTLIDFVIEVNYSPYNDSECLSLLESLRSRAAAILQEIEATNTASSGRGNESPCKTCDVMERRIPPRR
jgi:hypothetical protein